jgi:hypothetical protein
LPEKAPRRPGGRRGLWLLLGTLLAGCTSPDRFPPPTEAPPWQTRTGQAVWQVRPGAPALAGELVLARRPNGDFLVQFSKPPLTLVEASRTGRHWQVIYPAQARRFRGTGTGSPRLLWLWLPAALEGAALPDRVTFSRSGEGWRLCNRRTGESLEGYLAP